MSPALSLLALLVLSAPTGAELNERFTRGVRLFDQGRVADALLEFEALDAIKSNAAVRFNLAHCHARLGHPVRAVALLEPLIAAGKLSAERVALASALLKEQTARIATLELEGEAEGVLELDGASSKATLPTTLQVDPGPHNLTFHATGFFPARQVAIAAPGATTKVSLTLLRAERPPARVRVTCALPAVELFVDSRLLAKTPLLTPLIIAAGPHTLEARRAGYQPFSQPLALSEGVEEHVEISLEPVGEGEGTLRIKPTEAQAVVSVDGRLARADAPLRLPPGPHRLKVEREGFFPMQQVVELERELTLEVVLEPTSQTLVELSRRRDTHRFWGVLGVSAGGAAVLAGGLVWGLNQGTLSALETEVATLTPLCRDQFDAEACRTLGASAPKLTAAQNVRLGGIITLGLGALIAGAGGLSLFTAPDLSRYEERTSAGPLAPLVLSVGAGEVGVSGRF